MSGHDSGRWIGKLYLAGAAARAAAARREEDQIKLNHQLHQFAKFTTNSDEKSHSDAFSVTNTAMVGEKINFKTLTPVAESPNESLPPVKASPALQQTSVVELPVMQQLPCMQLNMQPLSVKKPPKNYLNTPAGDDDYAPHIDKEVDVPLPLPFDNLNEDEMAPL